MKIEFVIFPAIFALLALLALCLVSANILIHDEMGTLSPYTKEDVKLLIWAFLGFFVVTGVMTVFTF